MKTNRYLLGLALLVVGTMPAFSQVSNDNEDEVNKIDARAGRNDFVPGQVLVKFKDDSPVNVNKARGKFRSVGNSAVDAVLNEFNVEKMDKLLPNAKPLKSRKKSRAFNGEMVEEQDLSQLYLVETDESHAPQTMQLVDKLKKLDEVEYAEPNYKVYLTDAEIAGSFGGNPYTTQQWYLDDYGVKQLWNKPILNPKRPVIAILDTGVDMTHPDLAPNLWTNTAEAEGEADYDNDGNGFKGDVHGWDFINNTPNVKDFNMHGTHVAGIAAAANNGIGIIGANPMALIMPISVMQSDGTGDVATIVKGIDYAVQMGADVLNLSIGTYANSRAMRQALERAYQSAVIVAAAGNDGKCINSPHHPSPCYGAAPMFPAAYSFVLGVQATQSNGSLAGFSNYDDDGNTFSAVTTFQDPDGFNYELKAPGTDMLSTIPGGKYKVLNGTSMAAPLVAGSISALMMVKNYDSQEILWGDLLHTNNIAQAYAVANRPAELDLMKIMYRERKELSEETKEDYSGDGRIDAGETVSLYPVIRTTFGAASNIQMKLEMGDEYEDPTTVEILTPGWVSFGQPLSAYGKGVSLNPLQLKVAENVANGRHIKMKFVETCDETSTIYEGHFTMVVDNLTKIGGLLEEDILLTPDKQWLVTSNLAIPNDVTLTIKPGTKVRFKADTSISSYGKLVIQGEPGNLICLSCEDGSFWNGIYCGNEKDVISYCIIENCHIDGINFSNNHFPMLTNCIIRKCSSNNSLLKDLNADKINIVDNHYEEGFVSFSGDHNIIRSNYVNNTFCGYVTTGTDHIYAAKYSALKNSNYFNNRTSGTIRGHYYSIIEESIQPQLVTNSNPSYLGTSREDIIRPLLYDINSGVGTYAKIDLSNMLTEPVAEAHGIVWKVLVNGKDAQDEYEDLAPLGVGKHKFELYFNRPMNKAVAPQISFGVRDPYTQQVVNEEGEGSGWNAEGTIYTAYKTITGKTKSDGINRIYVYGAEDDEFFEIPYEKTRFNFMINAAGSMATGFAGEAQMGRVRLTWDNSENNFDDAMGFNVYRYQLDAENNEINNTRINQEIVDIETTEYTDYDVTPGETYYYMYKVLSTDLQEFDASNVVAVTPLTSELGDANGSGDVDVADVITTVNYAAGMNPKPFIFEAADVNTDLAIDILDVVGIIQKVLNPTAGARAAARAAEETIAMYSIEDGVLYVESPVALAGVQVQLSLPSNYKLDGTLQVAEDLNGFEHTSAWLSDNDYLFMAYNMSGKTLTPGKHALLHIGNAEVATIKLADAVGHNVIAVSSEGSEPTGIDRMGKDVMTVKGVYGINGQKMAGSLEQMKKLPKGVYIIDGVKVVK